MKVVLGVGVGADAVAEAVAQAVAAWADGAVVAVPTDTVYGLGVPLSRPEALHSIFDAKGRPEGLALPVLIGEVSQVRSVATGWPPPALALATRWWPGPLTLVVPAVPEVGALVGGDGNTVGVRCPDHALVRSLCEAAGPLAVTSANVHGEPPCHTADEVLAAIRHPAVALVLDCGTCDGVPSTVVDCTASPVRCVRPGGVAWEDIEATIRDGAAGEA